MKASEKTQKVWRLILAALFVVIGCFFLCSAISQNVLSVQPVGKGRAGDFGMRYNEICCAHSGINSYHIWTREITSDRWQGHDNPNVVGRRDQVPGKDIVHAYPPWHHVFLWPMGYLSRTMATALLYTLMGIAMAYLWRTFANWAPRDFDRKCVYWSVLFMFAVTPGVYAWLYGNYGILLAALSVLLLRNIDHGNQIAGGIIWALLMVKPQAGVLFFWPLFFRKRYVTIISAVLICLCATVVMGLVYGESPFDLILQIPKIGEPWTEAHFWPPLKVCPDRLMCAKIESVSCFIICGLLCFLARRSTDTIKLLLPVAFFIPIWTYSNIYDHVICWPIFLMLSLLLSGNDEVECRGSRLLVFILIILMVIVEPFRLTFQHNLRNPDFPKLAGWTCLLGDYFLSWLSRFILFVIVIKNCQRYREVWQR